MPTDAGASNREEPDASDATSDGGSGGFDGPLVDFGEYGTRSDAVVHAAILIAATIVVANVLVVVGMDLLATAGYTEADSPVAFYSVQMTLNFAGLFAVALTYLYWRDSALVWLGRPSKRVVGVMAGGFVVFAGLMIFQEALIDFLSFETAENVAVQRGQDNPELYLVMIPIQLFLTAPAEELLFRGCIQGLFRRAYGILPGVLIAAAIFSLFHIPALIGTAGLFPVLVMLFTSGALLGILYEYTQNLLVPIVIHALWNMAVFGAIYLDTVGALPGV